MDSILEKIAPKDSPTMQASFAEAKERRARGLAASEVQAELTIGGLFLLAALAVALLIPHDRQLDLIPALLVTGVFVFFSRVEIQIGAFYTVPTQIIFVPMLFMIPAELVPLFVALALVAGRGYDYLRGRMRIGRVLLSPGDAWFSIGPAVVLGLAAANDPLTTPWTILIAALAAQFAGELAAGALRERLHGGATLRQQIHESQLVYLVDASLTPVGLAVAIAASIEPLALLLACPLALLMWVFAHERETRIEQALELSKAYRGTAKLLGNVVEHDDEYTGLHTRGVVNLAIQVAERLGLDESQLVRTESAALLHDVGKIAVPKEIINKNGPLDDHEWAVIKTHTVKGQEMLEEVGGLMEEIGRVVRSCHERYDGGGYPDGLAGEQIPIEARVIFCCDAFNAMTTDRSYRKSLGVRKALSEMRENAGTQFDPVAVTALIAVIEDGLPAEISEGTCPVAEIGAGEPQTRTPIG